MTKRSSMLLIFCLVAVFLMTSIALAKNPKGPPGVSAEGVIYGCFKKVNGQLRVVSGPAQCRPSEVSIFWNQEGPEGPPGPPGLPGPPGTTNLLFVRQDPASPVTLANAETQVLSLTVPAGTYAISAKVSVANADTLIPQAASCKLSTGDVSAVVLGPDDNEQVISLLDAFTFPSETAIILSCNTLNGTATGGFLAAVEVELPTP